MADVITQGETMNRLIHQAVRRDLGRFEAALDALAPGDRSRAAALGEAFAHFDTMLTHHHEGEEHNLWPVIGDPAGGHEGDVATLTHEHEEIVAGLADSRAAFARLSTSATAADAADAAAGLARLRAAATTHFAHEEAEMRGLMEGADPDRLAVALKAMGRDAPAAQGIVVHAVGRGRADLAGLRRAGRDHPGAGAADLEGGRRTEVRAGAVGRLRLTCCARDHPQGRYRAASPNSCHR